ncbi:hypothetical protein EYF80_066120 [Liparis tanakae]|uniref:Uncharacterized protein n=1 Tax=Liparis tanakae TaxID=230148 RepID=A0A4Z2E4T1_9TELE|nr:hypothetical protein EYF80_066120 [Liparis tanakae]
MFILFSLSIHNRFWNRASSCCEVLANFQLHAKATQVAPSDRVPRQEGTSHLRSIVDGFVETPADLSVGVLSVPGACARHLLTEVRNAVVQRPPDVVVLLAPGNDLTGSRTVAAAGADFAKLLHCLLGRWTEVRYPIHYVGVYVIMLSVTFGEINFLNIYRLSCWISLQGVMYRSHCKASYVPSIARQLQLPVCY